MKEDASIARVIIVGEWEGIPIEAKQLLEDICKKWSEGKKVKFIITCGGFIQFAWPKSISHNEIGDNKNPNGKAVNELIKEAEKCANSVLNEDICKKLSQVTDYITLGIDSYNEKLHIELVFLKDLKQNKLYWTGKSYPTLAQENGLVRITNLKTHFFDLDIGKVMILVCHDLNIFNPRSKNARVWRREVNDNFKELAKNGNLLYVLHHAHTTVRRRTWLNAWSRLRTIFPCVQYAGAWRYYESDSECSEWDTLDEVLKDTKNTNTIDFLIWRK